MENYHRRFPEIFPNRFCIVLGNDGWDPVDQVWKLGYFRYRTYRRLLHMSTQMIPSNFQKKQISVCGKYYHFPNTTNTWAFHQELCETKKKTPNKATYVNYYMWKNKTSEHQLESGKQQAVFYKTEKKPLYNLWTVWTAVIASTSKKTNIFFTKKKKIAAQ